MQPVIVFLDMQPGLIWDEALATQVNKIREHREG